MYASALISVIFLNEHAQIYKDGSNLVPKARVVCVTLIERSLLPVFWRKNIIYILWLQHIWKSVPLCKQN